MSQQTVQVTVIGDTGTYWAPDGHLETITTPPGQDLRAAILDHARRHAHDTDTTLRVEITGDLGQHTVLVDPDGTLHAQPAAAEPQRPADAEAPETRAGQPAETQLPQPVFDPPRMDGAAGAVATRRRVSFVDTPPAPVRADSGLRGLLAAVGLPVHPSAGERARWDAVSRVSQHWVGCRAIAVGNGKGGVGKTMTAAMLAAVYARHGGSGVLAWDNNDTRGTLGWRTEAASHDRTVQDLLPHTDRLLAATASAGDIAGYVHHQRDDQYDVLRSNPHLLAVRQRIGQAEFDQLIQVATRYYRLIVFDSGNDESADRWLRMIDHADQLVIPTTPTPDAAESALLLLEELEGRDPQSAQLARDAVIIVTQHETGTTAQTERIVHGFRELGATVAIIPFDAALKAGPLRFTALRKDTRRAWIAAAAAATEHL